MAVLLGLDPGTSGCKAVLFELSGRILASGQSEYTMQYPQQTLWYDRIEFLYL